MAEFDLSAVTDVEWSLISWSEENNEGQVRRASRARRQSEERSDELVQTTHNSSRTIVVYSHLVTSSAFRSSHVTPSRLYFTSLS